MGVQLILGTRGCMWEGWDEEEQKVRAYTIKGFQNSVALPGGFY